MPAFPIREVIMIEDVEDTILIHDDDDCMMIDGISVAATPVHNTSDLQDGLEIHAHKNHQGLRTGSLKLHPSTPSSRDTGGAPLRTLLPKPSSVFSSRISRPSRRIPSQIVRRSSACPPLRRSIATSTLGSVVSPINLCEADEEAFQGEQCCLVGPDVADKEAPVISRSMKHQPGLDDILLEIEDSGDEEPVQVAFISETLRPIDRSRKSHPQRNSPVVAPYKLIDDFDFKSDKSSSRIHPGKYVELLDGDFLHIKAIVANSENNEIKLRGYRLQRCSAMNGMLERKLNELCYFYELDLDDTRPLLEQCVQETCLSEVRIIRNIRSTNQKFPLDRNVITTDFQTQLEAALNGGLTVRWKYTCTYATASHRYRNEYCERKLEHIGANESQSTAKISDIERRLQWRGETILGGSYQPSSSTERGSQESVKKGKTVGKPIASLGQTRERSIQGVKLIDLDTLRLPISPESSNLIDSGLSTPPLAGCVQARAHSSPVFPRIREPGQRLTYGDAFCGTGGTTRGAFMAGMKVKWGFDVNPHACSSWKANFPDADNYEVDCSTFVQIAQQHPDKLKMKVDILHLSPPCQFFSVAHSTDGKRDEENSATLFAVRDVINIAKPRVVTLEQTFGIMRTQFMWYLAALIQMFTSLDFSLRWAVVPLAEWGLPQSRKRLIMIASCPGEILPRIPAATHSRHGENGLKPFVTVNQSLRQICRNSPNHKVEDMKEKNEPPWDGNSILPRAMTCSGGQNYHPSGKRDFTDREYAVLQGFPQTHIFKGSYIRKQIGNAVPPCAAKTLFESIKRDLNRADGIEDETETLIID